MHLLSSLLAIMLLAEITSSSAAQLQTSFAAHPVAFSDSLRLEATVPEECLRICDLEVSGPACFEAPESDDCWYPFDSRLEHNQPSFRPFSPPSLIASLFFLLRQPQCLFCIELQDPTFEMLLISGGHLMTVKDPSTPFLKSTNTDDNARRFSREQERLIRLDRALRSRD
ncbi:hypothetical protein BDY24DRAFT_398524 [Mrakia frigida]|uniref:uncharacterized protein n=1 Tax=Mrakia frigida TaxID=29902 RepID=UPI003FCBFDD9